MVASIRTRASGRMRNSYLFRVPTPGDLGEHEGLEEVVGKRLLRGEMQAALRPVEARELLRVLGEERVGQRIDAAVPLPGGIRDKEPAGALECRHPVADGLSRLRSGAPDDAAHTLEELALVGREASQVLVDAGVRQHPDRGYVTPYTAMDRPSRAATTSTVERARSAAARRPSTWSSVRLGSWW